MKWVKKLLLKWVVSYVLGYLKEGSMEKIRIKLAGIKTYLIALAAIVGVVVAWTNGAMETSVAIKAIIEAILAITIRAGIDKKVV